MICYLIFSVLIAAAAFTVRRRSLLRLTGAAFYAVQAAFAVRIVAGGLYGETSAVWFAFDAAGTLFYCLLCIVSAFAFFHSKASLHDCDLRQTRTYAGLLMLLTTAIAGAYFASNLAVTWIFLEATTLCSAGIVYHRRTAQALEAAWKYVFVCSTGIAMAYLGILLLAAATDCESLDYATVAAAAPGGSALYLKTAFLQILCGYSCKAELFPLYTVGVDANFAAPAPASALISTGLVNAGFLALLRVYKLLAATEVFPWVKSVLLLVGVLSLVVGALFLRRTNNYKRFLSYSTVENMGIAAIGLGIGRCDFYLNLMFDEKLGATDLLLAEPVTASAKAAGQTPARYRTRTLVRALLNIDGAIHRLGTWVEAHVHRHEGGPSLAEGFVTASLLCCVGAMAVNGSLDAGIRGDNSILLTKSMIDLVFCAMLATTLGAGVMLAGAAVFVVEGALTLLAGAIAPLLSEATVADLTCAGSLLVAAIGRKQTGATKIKVADYLPALLFVPLIRWLVSLPVWQQIAAWF